MRTFSRTVSSMSSVSSCGTTPRRPRMVTPSFAGSRPKTRSVPSVTGETHPIMRMVDVFPAPLGPRKPNASPRRRAKSIPSTAVKSPKRFTSPWAWMSESEVPAATLGRLAIVTRRPPRSPRGLDVAGDLRDELLLGGERGLVAQALPELDDEPLPVEVAVEVEQVRLDPALGPAVVRIRPDRDGGAVPERLTRIDAELRAGEVGLES